MAALVETMNAMAPSNMPYTPELGAQIATEFQNRKDDGTAYASALAYVDSFVQYVKILDQEMNRPVGDSTAFVMAKYGQPIISSSNPNIGAYIASRLEQASQ